MEEERTMRHDLQLKWRRLKRHLGSRSRDARARYEAVNVLCAALAEASLRAGASFASALMNAILGLLVAWVLVRYDFPLKRLFDSLVDLPFALPTAVAGLVYSDLFAPRGWYGRFLVPIGIHGAYSRLGIVLVLVFIGFPFVVRTLQPVLEGLDKDVEEAAACLRANRPP